MRDLTQKERRFADLILIGRSASQAYREAYTWKGSEKRVTVKAHGVRHRPHVEAYIATEQAKTAELTGASRALKRRLLHQIMSDPKMPGNVRIAAIQTDNLMTGDNKPVRFEGEVTMRGIFEAMAKTTALPSPEEVIELDPNGPMATLK